MILCARMTYSYLPIANALCWFLVLVLGPLAMHAPMPAQWGARAGPAQYPIPCTPHRPVAISNILGPVPPNIQYPNIRYYGPNLVLTVLEQHQHREAAASQGTPGTHREGPYGRLLDA